MTKLTQNTSAVLIPLNKLKASPDNVRIVPHSTAYIRTLAENIHATRQLMPLIVKPEVLEGRQTGLYLVDAGEARRLAHLENVRLKRQKPDALISCIIDPKSGTEASLIENVLREAMHPADQFEAFRKLVEEGMTTEEIAAHFDLKPATVQQRLKMANVAPEFIALYREQKLTLEHIMAFAHVDDHQRQKDVWASLREYERDDAAALRRRLLEQEVSTKDPRVKFVTLKAYEKAGGKIRCDLFGDESDGFILDVDLLTRLVDEKLNRVAQQAKTAGAAWVEVRPAFDYSDRAEYGHVGTITREPTEVEREALAALERERAAVQERLDSATDEETEAACEEALFELDAREREMEQAQRVPNPAQQAVAGTVLTLDSQGKLVKYDGLLKPEDSARFQREESMRQRAAAKPRLHSAALTRRLSAQRTLGLQATLVRQPDVALVALAHRLLASIFHMHDSASRAIHIDVDRAELESILPDAGNTKAGVALAARHEEIAAELPGEPSALFGWLLKQPQSKLLELLAYCVAVSIDGVQQDEGASPLELLAQAAGLDMRQWWSVTRDTYLGSVSRERILDVLREAISPESAAALRSLKKAALASEAERRLAATGWLPAMLRTQVEIEATA